MGLTEVSASGLSSWETFDVLEPVDTYVLASETLLGMIGVNVTFYVNVTLTSDVLYDSYWLYESGRITLNLSENKLDSKFQVAFYPETSENFTNSMCSNGDCVLSMFGGNSTGFKSLLVNISTAQLAVIAEAGDLEEDVDAAIDNVLALLTTSFESCIPAFLNGFITGPLLQTANIGIHSGLNNADCEYIKDTEDPLDHPNPYATYSSIIASFILFLIVGLIGALIQRHRNKLQKLKEEQIITEDSLLLPTTPKPSTKETIVCESPCLLLHPRIPAWIRYIMPLLLGLNTMIFISSNTSGGASVYLALTTGLGRMVSFKPLFTFTLANSVHVRFLCTYC